MGIFSSIRNAIFGAPRATQPAGREASGSVDLGSGGLGASGQAAGGSAFSQLGNAPPVDVGSTLERIHRDKGSPDLNYKSSIVDLMKLLDLDPSLDNRKALATELGYTGAKDGSAEMNMWLHRKVMEELERHGGRVPERIKD